MLMDVCVTCSMTICASSPSLERSQIADKGARAFGEALKVNQGLTTLQ